MPFKLPKQSEKSFQAQVLQLAKLKGWRTAHFRPAKTDNGWRTAVQGDGKGFPDLVLVRADNWTTKRKGRLIFAELKSDGKGPSEIQNDWLFALSHSIEAVEVYIWRPSDWDEIMEVLE